MKISEYEVSNIRKLPITASYHNHNYLCGHAGGEVIDYVKRAEEVGLTVLGISDHGPMPDAFDRMHYDDFFTKYLPQFDQVKNPKLKLLKGLELEYEDGLLEYYQELKKHVDYFVLGQHCVYLNGKRKAVHEEALTDEELFVYRDTCIEALRTGLFAIFAHPEIAFYRSEVISPVGLQVLEDLVKEAIRLDIPLECNANGLRRSGIGKERYRYPRQEYLDLLKKYNAKVIVSDDAHSPNCICDEKTKMLYTYLEDEGFNLLYRLDL